MILILEALIFLGLAFAILSIGGTIVRGFNQRKMKALSQKDDVMKLAMTALSSKDSKAVKRTIRVAGNLMEPDVKLALEEHAEDLEEQELWEGVEERARASRL